MLNFGTDDRIEKYTLDTTSGGIKRIEYDMTGDGYSDKFSIIQLDSLGRAEMRIDYTTMEGTYGVKESYTLDSSTGLVTRMERDNGNNGSIERIEEYTYDPLGNKMRIYIDNNGMKGWDIIENYTINTSTGFNSRKDIVKDVAKIAILTTTPSTEVESDAYEIYHRDALGRIEKMEVSNDGKNISSLVYRKFNEQNRLVWQGTDTTLSSKDKATYEESDINIIQTFSYDPIDRVLDDNFDSNADGKLNNNNDRLFRYEYLTDSLSIRHETFATRKSDVYIYKDLNDKEIYRIIDVDQDKKPLDKDSILEYGNRNPTWDRPDLMIFRKGEKLAGKDYEKITLEDVQSSDIIYVEHSIFNNQSIRVIAFRGKTIEGGDKTEMLFAGYGEADIHTEDATMWSTTKWSSTEKTMLDMIGGQLGVIVMNPNSAAARESTLIIDKETIAKISQASLTTDKPSIRIQGDNLDSLKLNGFVEGDKLAGTKMISGQEYHQYKFTFDKDSSGAIDPATETYTLLVDTDIHIL